MEVGVFFACAAILGLLVYLREQARFQSRSAYQQFYDNIQFSAEEFYTRVEEGLKKQQVPYVDYAKESFLESHVLSAKREYLRIAREEFVIFVGAAKFGTGMFVSTWLCEKKDGLLDNVPILANLMGKNRERKTFYQMDTEAMYKSTVQKVVSEALEKITEEKGIRGLPELQEQPNYLQ